MRWWVSAGALEGDTFSSCALGLDLSMIQRKQAITHYMAKQRKSHETRRGEIIQSALDLVAETGGRDVTAQAIADRVGIAQPTVFRHFPTRSAIFRAAMEWAATALFGSLAMASGPGELADTRLRRLLQRQFAFINAQRGVSRLLFSDRLHQEDPALKATVRRIMERYTAYLQTIIQDGIDSGRFRQTLDPEGTARFVVAEIQGVVMRWSIYDFEFRLEDEVDAVWRVLESALVISAGTK